jgi:anti-sigma B factor antagonist
MQTYENGGPGFSVVVEESDEVAHVGLVGELDMVGAPKLQDTVDALISAGQRTVRLDLGRLTFCDSSGISALIQVRAAMAQAGGELVISGATGSPRKALQVTGLLDLLTDSGNQTSVEA